MKKLLLIILMFVSVVCVAQTEKQMKAGFPHINFDYFHREYKHLYKSSKSIIMTGLLGDSVMLCYISRNKKVERIKVLTRYTDSTNINYDFTYSEAPIFWEVSTTDLLVAHIYLGNIKDIELGIGHYKYEILLTEYTNKKAFVLLEVITYY